MRRDVVVAMSDNGSEHPGTSFKPYKEWLQLNMMMLSVASEVWAVQLQAIVYNSLSGELLQSTN